MIYECTRFQCYFNFKQVFSHFVSCSIRYETILLRVLHLGHSSIISTGFPGRAQDLVNLDNHNAPTLKPGDFSDMLFSFFPYHIKFHMHLV